MENLYPPNPSSVPAEITQPNKQYRKQVWLAVLSLLVFIAAYFGLAFCFIVIAYHLTIGNLHARRDPFWEYIIGACAAFLAIFMLKAIFFIKKTSHDHEMYEVTAKDQPALFQFINQLADDAGAPRPYKVYLSARVNAAVFYDLSILNMIPFFPAKKNLEIGTALINTLNLSEFKAVLAHEFGHFAQRSMAIGTWVYMTQKIAASMIAKRDALDKFLNFLCNIDLRVAWIGWGLSLVVWSIRSLMDSLLNVVILAQRALSRQMEFQADLVAVRLTGSDQLVNALHKLQAADDAWQQTIDFTLDQLQRQDKKPHDLFAIQNHILQRMESILADPHYLHPPQAPLDKKSTHRVFKNNFANPPQMWLTHPANVDREENAKKIYVNTSHDERSPWLLFKDIDHIKIQTLSQLFHNIDQAKNLNDEEIHQALNLRYGKLQYHPQYRGAYLGRALTRTVVDPTHLYDHMLDTQNIQQTLSALYPTTLSDDLKHLRELTEECATLEALKDNIYKAQGGRIIFRGKEIQRRALSSAIKKVKHETNIVRQRILNHDKKCRSLHLHLAKQLGNGWDEYFKGLLHVIHYAEHTLADILDVQGVLGNVVAVITADGNVSSRELKRLLKTINEVVYPVLERVYRQQQMIKLDPLLCHRLEITNWSDKFEEFTLPLASNQNINEWMQVIDGWLNSAIRPLAQLAQKSLEQLLFTEQQIQRAYQQQYALEEAPHASQIQGNYPSFTLGKERPLQKRLGLWDRFLIAEGYFGASLRFLVASTIVGSVLILGFIGFSPRSY